MKFSEEEIQKRKIVWLLMSDLFVDTEHERSNLEELARKLKNSGYTLQELNTIFLEEVHPALYASTYVWPAFDEQKLQEKITAKLRRNFFLTIYLNKFRRWLIPSGAIGSWENVMKIYAEL